MVLNGPPRNGQIQIQLNSDDCNDLAQACHEAAARLKQEKDIANQATIDRLAALCNFFQLGYYATRRTNGDAFEAAFVAPTE